ncbi:protein kinase family protein [Pantoea phytobeneficialis]|uniref:Protein kinase n=1 Tax=Pantoea phytobeneficialis TaxID=2052056 RepID=A0AAP9KQJ7_9GAMM|nr:protein kinase family protein [Pantoea phytobeneficialis]MDO6408682.1 protein kinase family protein [Pantoea phytobeneficialis]QGR08111.1 protein kinase [Pantoea phytobeneficialis]
MNRYELIKGQTFSGGFGNLQLVKDTYLDREVLFKRMSNPQDNDQLINEIQALSKARSRHVIEIYDLIRNPQSGLLEGIIIEFLKGRDYLNYHNETPFDSYSFLIILYQISHALYDLHNSGIVHRDLKLENIKSSETGVLKLYDFGLSSTNEDYYTKSNRGTIIYAAPELYVSNAKITTEMDIYAFGICAWNLVTTTRNFSPALLEKPPMRSKPYTTIGRLLTGKVNDEIINTIDSCLNSNPSLRPSSKRLTETFYKHLLYNKHKGLFVEKNSSIYELSHSKTGVRIKLSHGEIIVNYDGFDFIISAVSGEVYINNTPAQIGDCLPNACLITFGRPEFGSGRRFVTFLSSHPELVI